ncbi:MAG: hypothetical protein N2738_02925, partial [Thermodesulfovibrionales bacterium]|nr:hypothetical protein [Thermodesulfovibrionales bacterium]
MAENKERIDFILGEELPFEQIIFSAGVKPLLQTVISVGATAIAITDIHGKFIIAEGYQKNVNRLSPETMSNLSNLLYKGTNWLAEIIFYEGECVGYLVIEFNGSDKTFFESLIKIISTSLKAIIFNTSKRLVTTELHTTTVKRSYEELVSMYENLAQSEKKYRELSQTLEQKVEERTEELKKAYVMMIQKEKMASIGQLAAGIAHEINNPMSYIISNLKILSKYLKSFEEFLNIFVNNYFNDKNLQEAFTRLKLKYKLQDSGEIITQCLDGAEKVKKIVMDLKGFSHIDEAEKRDVDINEEIDKTLNVLY